MSALLHVCQMFEHLAMTPGRKDKEALLRALEGEEKLIAQKLFRATLNPYVNYGNRTVALPASFGYSYDAEPFFDALAEWAGYTKNNDATIQRVLKAYPEPIAKWLRYVVLRDLGIGVSTSTVNKIWPGLVPQFACMAAEVFSAASVTFPLWAEPKIDGVRAIMILRDRQVQVLSRDGKPLLISDGIRESLRPLLEDKQNMVLDGELYAGSFNKTMQVVKTKVSTPDPVLLDQLEYLIFDMLPLHAWEATLGTIGYEDRRAMMRQHLPWSGKVRVVDSVMVSSSEDLEFTTTRHLTQGFEGSMLKVPNGPYVWDRSRYWLKHKPVNEGDFEITDVIVGSGRNSARLGAFTIKLENGTTCEVGGGFSDAQRDAFWKNPPVGKICQVEFKERTPDGLLREPVFVRIRDDKAD